MKKISGLMSMILVAVFILGITVQPAFASESADAEYDLYENRESESVNIDGINYRFFYYYENGNKAIDITNGSSGHVDKLIYDEANHKMYFNGEQFFTIDDTNTMSSPIRTLSKGWESIGKSSHVITWKQSTTAAALAAAIAVYVGSLGSAGVIAAMGIAALGAIAANTTSGTVTVDIQWYKPFFGNPQYRYIWSFTTSTRDTFGPYIYNVTT